MARAGSCPNVSDDQSGDLISEWLDSCERRRSVRRHHAGVRAWEVDRLVAVLPADPIVLPLALPHHLDHLTMPAERVERGGVDDDLIALLGVHAASSGSTPTGSSEARKIARADRLCTPVPRDPGTARPRVPGDRRARRSIGAVIG